jgi:hypothetical protein
VFECRTWYRLSPLKFSVVLLRSAVWIQVLSNLYLLTVHYRLPSFCCGSSVLTIAYKCQWMYSRMRPFFPYVIICEAVWKVCGLTLLLRVGTLWRCGDGLFFEVPPLAIDALLTTLYLLLENVLQTVCRKLQEDPLSSHFMVGKSQKSNGARSVLYGECSNGFPPIHFFQAEHRIQSRNADAPLRKCLVAPPSWKGFFFKTTVIQTLTAARGMKITPLLLYPHHYNLA